MSVTEDLVKTWDIHVVAKGSGHKRNAGEPKYDPRVSAELAAVWVSKHLQTINITVYIL